MKNRPWDKYREKQRNLFVEDDTKQYINDDGLEVPENTIAFYNVGGNRNHDIKDVVEPLVGHPSREWFAITAFSFCLPLTIANQYGFVVKAAHDIDLYHEGGVKPVSVKIKNYDEENSIQNYATNFENGILSIENQFILRTPPEVNLMVMQPPNYFITGIHAMSGVVEADNLRRTFTFNLKVTNIKTEIKIKKGDWLAAFIPIPRYYADMFKLVDANKLFSKNIIENEISSMEALIWERHNSDLDNINASGRRYFRGVHVNQTDYKKHQKRAGIRD